MSILIYLVVRTPQAKDHANINPYDNREFIDNYWWCHCEA